MPQLVAQNIKDGAVTKEKIPAAAGIEESKLGLNYATHSPANDPTTDEKSALAGEGTPSGSNKFTTKSYVDSIAAGVRDPKDACRLASTGNIATLSGLLTVDGKTCVAGDRVLVRLQTASQDNGIYVAAAGAWSRSPDADVSAEVTSGMSALITDGDTLSGTGWVLTTPDPITLGTTPLTLVQTKAPDSILAGAGMTRTGNTMDVIAGDTSITVGADSLAVNPAANGGLEVSSGLKVKAGNGIEVVAGGTQVKAVSTGGIDSAAGGVSVKLPALSGLVTAAAGLTVQGAEDETVSGSRNSMTLSYAPIASWALEVFYCTALCRRVVAAPGALEYTWSGTTVTLGFTAADTEWLYARYLY